SRPLKFELGNIGDAWRPAVSDLQNMGIDLEKMAARVERKVARSLRHVGHRTGQMAGNFNLGRWVGGRDYYIKVPYDCDLGLRTSTGDLDVSGVNGTHFIQSTAGDTQ